MFYIFVFVLSNSSWSKYHQICQQTVLGWQMTTQHETKRLKYTQQNKQTPKNNWGPCAIFLPSKQSFFLWLWFLLMLCFGWATRGQLVFFVAMQKSMTWHNRGHTTNKKTHTKKVKTTAADIILILQNKQIKWSLSTLVCTKTMFVDLVPQTII